MMGKLRKQSKRALSMGDGSDLTGVLYHRVIPSSSASRFLGKGLKDCDSVLDLGYGENSMLRFIQHPRQAIGVDAWRTCAETSRRRGIHDDYIMADITKFELADKSVYATILKEALEHLTKEEAIALLDRLKRITRRKIILTTPNGYLPQENPENPYQLHKSGWEIDEMRGMGFTAYNWVCVLRAFGRKSDRPLKFLPVQSLPQKIAYHFPRKANGFICKMDLVAK